MAVTTIATAAGPIFRFDGEVLEVFSYDESRRIHILQVAGAEVGSGFLGGTAFTVHLKQGTRYALQLRLQANEQADLAALANTLNSAAAL